MSSLYNLRENLSKQMNEEMNVCECEIQINANTM